MRQHSKQFRFDPLFGCESKIWIPSFVFALAFYIFETLYLKIGWASSFQHFEPANDILLAVILLVYLLASFYLFFLFTLLCIGGPLPFKLFGIVLFTISTLIQYGYQQALSRFAHFSDLTFALSATPDQRSTAVAAFADTHALIPIVILAVGSFIAGKGRAQIGNRIAAIIVLMIGLFYIQLALMQPVLFGSSFNNNSFGAFITTAVDLAVQDPMETISPLRRDAVESIVGTNLERPPMNIVIVFDESIRADHLSLNGYQRPTTPYLEKLHKDGKLVNWGTAVSSSTSSHPSYDAFISGATPEMIAENGLRKINTLPSIFQYARAMNFKTHFIDGQMMKYWGGLPEDVAYIDDLVTMAQIDSPDRVEDWQVGPKITNDDLEQNKVKQWEIDAKIAHMVRSIVDTSTGNFIFVYKRGSHFPYEKNYPAEAMKWTPIFRFSEQWEVPPSEQINSVINSYDNSIKYNLDNFFRILLDKNDLKQEKTVILYTSDHGETFNGRAGHGGKTKEEATVPFFVLGLENADVDTTFPVTHANIFTSVLDLMKYPARNRDHQYATSIFDNQRVAAARSYNSPQGEKLPFD